MNQLKLPNYNLHNTLLGGQAFNWDYIDGYYYGFTQDKAIKLKLENDILYWQTYPINDDEKFIKRYLNLNINYEEILLNINKDLHIKTAIETLPNLRILKQDFDQTVLSFILTSHKNIKAVRKSVRDLANKYGEKIDVDGRFISLFPKTDELAALTEEDLRASGVGFRAPYLKEATNRLAGKTLNIDFKITSESDARAMLISNKGIGDKVADCILTFSLGYYTVTPIDLWAKRVAVDLYGVNSKLNYKETRQWFVDYFGEYTAFAGQFLFEYLRSNYSKLLKK